MATSTETADATGTADDATTRRAVNGDPQRTPMASDPASAARSGSRSRGARHAVELPLSDILLPWLDVFRCCTTKWGLVTAVRDDGSKYKRHGIVVELCVDMTDALKPTDERSGWKLRRIRQGVDLVNLALAVDPHALMVLFARESVRKEVGWSYKERFSPDLTEEDLEAVTLGDAPFQLSLKLEIRASAMYSFEKVFNNTFMRRLDEDDIQAHNASPTAVRRYLFDRCDPSARRIVETPVRTVLEIEPRPESSSTEMLEELPATWCFDQLTSASEALNLYQRDRCGESRDVANRYVPLVVERIKLNLLSTPLTHRVIRAITVLMASPIPVSSSSFRVDVRVVSSPEHKLQAFLDAIIFHEQGTIFIHTGVWCSDREEAVDAAGEDFSSRILQIMRCVGRLANPIQFDLTFIINNCRHSVNRCMPSSEDWSLSFSPEATLPISFLKTPT